MAKGEKKATLDAILAHLRSRGEKELVFSNRLVKEITGSRLSNQFDVTKVDTSSKLPETLRREDLFIVHLGGGEHRFVKGIGHGYHLFEDVPPDRVRPWEYVPGLMDGTDKSEAGVLSLAFNQDVIQHFLFGDRKVQLKIQLPRRTRDKILNTFEYNVAKTTVSVNNLQIETDFIVERNGDIAIGEAKYSPKVGFFPEDFAVAQVYLPYRRLLKLRERKNWQKKARCMFLVHYKPKKTEEAIRIYEYDFDDWRDMASIKLVKNAEYRLEAASIG